MQTQTYTPAENLRGSLFMLLAMASFAVGDTLMKVINLDLPLSQILVIRGCIALVGFFAIAYYFKQLRNPMMILNGAFILRLLGEVIATFFFLTALFNMPMANASAIMQALPLTVSLGAAYFFGEAIGWRRILAISIGFAGVLMIVKPGLEGFTIYSLYCLVGVAGTTLRDLATRKLPKDIPSLFVSLVTVGVVLVMGLLLSLFENWQPVGVREIGFLTAAACFLMTGFFGIVSAMRVGEVALVTPFRYTVLIFAVALGFLVFSEVPDQLTIAGSLIIVLSGVYTLYRERVRGQKNPMTAGRQ